MPKGGTQTAIEPGIVARVTGAVRYAITGVTPNDWFGPSQPQQPMAPADVEGRRYDYMTGANLNTRPRAYTGGAPGITFPQLRFLASSWSVLASIIQSRQDQLCGSDWEIGIREGSTLDPKGGEVRAALEFMENPAQGMNFQQWLRAVSYDTFVLDGVALYKWRNKGGKLYAWQPLDAANFALLLDQKGQTPVAPSPAYQQILKGIPAVDYTTEELNYLVENVRTNTLYGYSRVEQIITTINIALRRDNYNLGYYSEGNIPPGIASLPKEWTPEQIKQFQTHWDWQLATQDQRQKMRFVPGDTKYQPIVSSPMMDEFDEWTARIACYAFSVSPQPFAKQMNRATSETAKDTAEQEGLRPLKRHLRTAITKMLREEFHPDLQFVWTEADETDQKEAAETATTYVKGAIMTVDEQRQKLGLPLLGGAASRLQVITATGAVQLNTELDDQGNKLPVGEEDDPFNPKPEPVDTTGDETAPKGGKSDGKDTQGKKKDDAGVAEKGAVKKSQASRGFMTAPSAAIAVTVLVPQLMGVLSDIGVKVGRAILLGHLRKADSDEDAYAGSLALEADLSDLAGVGDIIEVQVGAVLESAAKQTLYETLADMPTDGMFNQVNERAAAYAQQRAAELVSEITASTRNMLRELIAGMLKEGASIPDIATAISAGQPFSAARARLIAETEVGNAFGAGQLIALRSAKAEGVKGLMKEWVDNEASACPLCAANAAQGPIALHRRFSSGDMAPLAHPNCRCTIVGVMPQDGK